jgi:hypothetical protein
MQFREISPVSHTVSFEFGFPVRHVASRLGGSTASFMPMPKASVHEYDGPVFGQDDIWISWEVLVVKSEPVTATMKEFADQPLRARV